VKLNEIKLVSNVKRNICLRFLYI